MSKRFLLFISIVLIYWILSCIALYDIVNSTGVPLPYWLDIFLFPGYILGLILGYGGGSIWVITGQLITLIIMIIFAWNTNNQIEKRKHNKS